MNSILKELKYGAKNYKPLNVILKKGKGVFLTDVNNKKYFDFLSGYSAVNQGHCHPRLINALNSQSEKLTLTSRAFYNNKLGDLCEYMCNTFNYTNFIPMNSGVEACETAIKISRKWGYEKKNIEYNKAINLFCYNNFWGRTISALSSSNDKSCYNNFAPYTPGFELIEYNNLNVLENKLKSNPNIVSFMLEPIQGEAGVILPSTNYLKNAYKLCEKYNVLLIADEVQSGLGRSGKLLACDYDNIRPHILILGKSLSGGIVPASGVLANKEIMSVLTPGTHGSTYGGNPLACAVSLEALKVLFEEDLINNSYKMGKYFRKELRNLNLKNVKEIRGKGLFNAIEFKYKKSASIALENLKNNGLLTNITKNKTLRLTPPLIINKNQIDHALEIIDKSINL
jgi:ornithine--oxo-acid transaminase